MAARRGVRKGSTKKWSELAPSYRRRLQRQGIGYREWLRGDPLGQARGHQYPTPRRGQADRRLIQSVTTEQYPSVADVDALRIWRDTLAPAWLPSRQHMSDRSAAALSQLRNPRYWDTVALYPRDGGPWLMVVTYLNGFIQEIELPTGLEIETLDLLALSGVGGYTGDDAAWAAWVSRGRDYDVEGTL